jgi:uncharacterized protein YbaR (Trm112 family)
MLRDLLDSLRCPRPHEESWLVAMVHRADGPNLLDAELACPVCGAEFRVTDGVARFDEPVPAHLGEPVHALRLAAQLGVTEGVVPVLLTGGYTSAGAELSALTPVPQVWVNGSEGNLRPVSGSVIIVSGRVPLGVETLAGAAVDEAHAETDMLESIVRAVRIRGRIVAPAHIPLPSGVRELARDDAEWVAEVTTRASGLVELRRRAPDQVG